MFDTYFRTNRAAVAVRFAKAVEAAREDGTPEPDVALEALHRTLVG